MDSHATKTSLRRDRLFRNSFAATIVAILGCLSTHVLGILGVTAAVAWAGTVEHALAVGVLGGAGLTLYALLRHRRYCGSASSQR